jgi:hypothetical protein
MIYCCEKCKGTFPTKFNYERHINRKTPCVFTEKEQYDIERRSCQYCPKILSTVHCCQTHMKTCKYKPNEVEQLKQIIIEMNDKLNEKMNVMSEKIDKVEKPNITNVTNINNNIQNIIVVPFGKEDLSCLTLKDYKKIFNKGCYSIPEIVKLIHCNEDKPEFMNVYIKNFKDEYMFTFDGKDWDIEKKDDVLANMIENKKNFLESKFDDMQDSLPQYAINMFKKFLERTDDNEVIANIKDELKNMFYKNRHHVIKNIKNLKNPKKVKELTNCTSIITQIVAKNEIKNTVEGIEKKPKKKNSNK